ncbi:MAG: type III secretion system cytoplasmic ring protein SctQ [Desulfovibrio sp.]|nr:type III secretion system cytoplasmic ring protein SctQ [Desulfovibrio sp.]
MSDPFRALPLPPGSVRLWNALVCRLQSMRLSLDNGQPDYPVASITCPMTGCEDVFATGAAFTLYANMNGLWRVDFGNLDVLALRPELAAWLQADVGNRFALLPVGLVRAVLERLFLPVLDGISRHTGIPGVFVGAPRAFARPIFTEHLDMLLCVEGKYSVNVPLRISWQDTATLTPFVEKLEAQPLPAPTPQWQRQLAAAMLTGRIILGFMRLLPQELASLNTGDVLLPTRLTSATPQLSLASGLSLACALDGDTLTLRGMEASSTHAIHGEKPMSNDVADNGASLQGSSSQALLDKDALNKLELDITFELPGVQLSLAEWARLTPGYTFRLSADVAQMPVTVCVGGRAVALGRLVDVGGAAGVQITQLAASARQGMTEEGD